MIGLSIIYWVLIIAAAIFEVLLIIKFWKMCNDIRALRNHFIQVPQSEQSTKPQSGQVSGAGLFLLVVFIGLVIIAVIFA